MSKTYLLIEGAHSGKRTIFSDTTKALALLLREGVLVEVEHEGIITLDGYTLHLTDDFDYERTGNFMLMRVEDTDA
jgi:hypothetical protein